MLYQPDTLLIDKKNEVFMTVHTEPGLAQELNDYFTFFVPGYRFMPSFKNKMWDGKIRLFNLRNKALYIGLIDHVIKFAKDRGYKIEYKSYPKIVNKYDKNDFERFAKSLNLTHSPRDYQIDAFLHAINHERCLLLSPTASGKSFIIYLILRYYQQKLPKFKALIIVPTTSLVAQMSSDFNEYAKNDIWNSADNIHAIFAGRDKVSEKPIYISTWQSLYKLPPNYFSDFSLVLGDECLSPDTDITMGDGTLRKIKDICVGEYVKTYNEVSKEIENKPVLKVHKNLSINEKMYEITLDGFNKIKITGNHKVLLTNGEWKRVDSLKIGDRINSIE